MVIRERLADTFVELVRIDSISKKEGKIGKYLKKKLGALGAKVIIDSAGEKIGGEMGNLIARIPGNVEDVPVLMFNAHLDTVSPGEGVKPELKEETFATDGSTILGADDKSGIAIILEVINILKERRLSRGNLELVFTVGEEIGLLGAKNLDYSLLKAKHGYCLDASLPDSLITRAPAANRMEFKIYGLESHAGVEPERGINAIIVASEAISRMKLGRIDHETTANIGKIRGGTATNIIPNLVEIKAEARSHSEKKLTIQTEHMRNSFNEVIRKYERKIPGKGILPRMETNIERDYPAMDIKEDAFVVGLAKRSGEVLKKRIKVQVGGGGSDANIFNSRGIETAILGTGMEKVHTVEEYIRLDDMVEACRLILKIIEENVKMKGVEGIP
jgi:tripeptide aminopeptidase